MNEESKPPRQLHDPKAASILENWSTLTNTKKIALFRFLPRTVKEEVFLNLSSGEQRVVVESMPHFDRMSWIRILHPDDAADLVQEFPVDARRALLDLLDEDTRADVEALLAYAEDEAGGIMNPQFVRLRPDITIDVAVRYLRAQARRQMETIYYAYVIDHDDKLLGTISFRELLLARPDKLIQEVMTKNIVTIPADLDQEEVSRRFSASGLNAIPVVDSENRIKGVVTLNDIVDVVQKEATEDIQKLGGMEALDAPYFEIGLLSMIKKRAGWLVILFVGEMFTATAMGYFQREIERAVVLALFIPLIISSGGNTGSQATTLIIRAMALGEVRIKDWWRVFLRELSTGLALGAILGAIGLVRILLWPARLSLYGEHYVLVAVTVSCSLIGIVLWGTLAGSMLPFVLRKVGFDPASASAPFVATLVDVTGIIIYFSVASLILSGTLL
ncbi:MAG: magnesium transporter [Bdellovibrionota bacterium]